MSPINFLLCFKNGKSIQYEILTIATSFNDINNHAKMMASYFVVFTPYVRILDYPQFQKLQKKKKKKKKKKK